MDKWIPMAGDDYKSKSSTKRRRPVAANKSYRNTKSIEKMWKNSSENILVDGRRTKAVT